MYFLHSAACISACLCVTCDGSLGMILRNNRAPCMATIVQVCMFTHTHAVVFESEFELANTHPLSGP
jgi:hypothetical protein